MRYIATLAVLLTCLAQSASAAALRPPTADELRARAMERCKANRGVDCDTPEGLREWIQQEQPMTEEQRRAAVGRRAREQREQQCKSAPGKGGC